MSRIDHHMPRYPELIGQFKRSYHLEMITDRARTSAIFAALERALRPETVFCELGCGTGIFSLFAAARARRVFAIEIDPTIADTARENFARSRFGSKIELIQGDARDVHLPEKADVIFCEMMSIWAVEEPQIPVFNAAFSRHLAPGGLFLPQRIVNLVALGHYNFEIKEVSLRAALPLFTGMRKPALFTETRVARVLDFSAPVDMDLGVNVELPAVAGGVINAACLTSIVQMGPDIVFSGSDSLMPPTVVPLHNTLTVRPGELVRFRASLRARSDLDEGYFLIERSATEPATTPPKPDPAAAT